MLQISATSVSSYIVRKEEADWNKTAAYALHVIASNLSPQDFKSFRLTCRKFNEGAIYGERRLVMKNRYIEMTDKRVEADSVEVPGLIDSMHAIFESQIRYAPLINALGGAVKMKDLPILDVSRMPHERDYMDYIQSSDMTHPVMRGIDPTKRPFVAFKLVLRDERDAIIARGVVTLFQRYSNQPHLWTFGSRYLMQNQFVHTSTGTLDGDPNLSDRIRRLMEGKPVGRQVRTKSTILSLAE